MNKDQTVEFGTWPVSREQQIAAALALLEFQSPTATLVEGRVPLASRLTIWLIAGLVGSTLGIMGVMPIDRVITAQGRIAGDSHNIVVQPLDVSIVRSINVKEGQTVHAGDLLAQLDATYAAADTTASESQVTSLQAEVDRLEAEVANQTYKSDGSPAGVMQALLFSQRTSERAARRSNYDEKISSAESKIEQSKSDLSAYKMRRDLAWEVEKKRKDLENRQLGSQLNTFSAMDNRMEMTRGYDNAAGAYRTASRDRAALIAERDGYIQQNHVETSQQLSDAQRKLADVRGQFDKSRLRRRLVDMRAERDATVLRLANLSVGSVMQSGDEFITLVPTGTPLAIDVSIPGRDAGFLQVGNPVTIKFDTFDYRAYGTAKGAVETISADSFPTSDLVNPRPTSRQSAARDPETGQSFYRARVSLEEVNLRGLSTAFKPTLGMPVTVDIKIGQRTVLSYFLARVVPLLTEGMREP